ncbi:hypothetical protein AAE478_008987 [Parahypoxylon ruwenzoriense]
MKFLCLHGMGTNSDIHEAQLAPILAQLDPAHEFVFVDGLIQCEPADGAKGVFPGPFYCYYDKPVLERLQAAYNLIQEVIDDEGPFYGVVGFSQGSALAASLILHHQRTQPYAPDLFKIAIFTCASLPFDSASESRKDKYHTIICEKTGGVRVRDLLPGETVEASRANGFITAPAVSETVLRRYHPEREEARIRTPSVHIMGTNDLFLPQSRALAELCSPPVDVVTHDLGHQLPRDSTFARKAASAIENCIHRALSTC